MVLVVVSPCGANTVLARVEIDNGRALTTHQTTQPKPTSGDVEQFRRSPKTIQRFGFWNAVEARVRGFGDTKS